MFFHLFQTEPTQSQQKRRKEPFDGSFGGGRSLDDDDDGSGGGGGGGDGFHDHDDPNDLFASLEPLELAMARLQELWWHPAWHHRPGAIGSTARGAYYRSRL